MTMFRYGLCASLVTLLAATLVACPAPQQAGDPADQSVSATVTSQPVSASRGAEDVQVRATGPSSAEIHRAAKEEAAKEVAGSLVSDRAFDDAAWPEQVDLHTEIVSGASPRRLPDGRLRIEATVRVNSEQLNRWFDSAGYLRDVTSVTGFSGNVPEPTVAVMPFAQRGEFPEQLSPDQQTVATLIGRQLGRDPYNITMQEYETLVRAGGAQAREVGVDQENPEYLIAADIYLGFDVRVEDARRDQIRAVVTLRGILVTTQDTVFETQEYSQPMASDQREAAIEQAASTAIRDTLREIAAAYNDEYTRGIPYIVAIRNVHTDAAMMSIQDTAMEFSADNNYHRWEQRDGVVSFMIRADPQNWAQPSRFAMALRQRLGEEGYPHVEGSQSNRHRFISFELQSN